jgi:hypothetical protein
VDDGRVALRTVAGLLGTELTRLVGGDIATEANVRGVRNACEVVRKELATLAKLDLLRPDEPGLAEFQAALESVIQQATAILQGRASLDDASGYPQAVFALADWRLPGPPGQREFLN